MILTRDQIVKAEDIEYEIVSIPEWGGDVKLKTMTGTERDAWESSVFRAKGKVNNADYQDMRAKLLSRCIVGEDDKRLFSDKEVAAVGAKNASILDRLYIVAAKLNAIGADDEEELLKNSDGEVIDSSISASQQSSV